MDRYIIKKSTIDRMRGLTKTHFLNPNARRINKSLGDYTGLTGLGFHIIEIAPGHESTEYHMHYHEDECVYILEGSATVTIDERDYTVEAGDFIGYRAGGLPHTMRNDGTQTLKCIVVGQRLPHDVGEYPRKNLRLFRNQGLRWNLVDMDNVEYPDAGKKK
ncbi:MAG: cupin domain-containing protein [Leptospiraceae bacterium]|nr:cupin domain-containing protein [Leptospiraceae bacterium]